MTLGEERVNDRLSYRTETFEDYQILEDQFPIDFLEDSYNL